MNTDLELLKMAAKAAGYDIRSDAWACGPSGMAQTLYMGNCGPSWNPLTDDGDALRLAVQCGIEISIVDDEPDKDGRFTRACAGYSAGPGSRLRYVFEDHCGDLFAATRRAIVRAAAEIGKATA